MKHCSKCHKDLPARMFGPNAYKLDGFQSWCRRCVRLYAADLYKRGEYASACPRCRVGRGAQCIGDDGNFRAPHPERLDLLLY